MLLLVTLLPLAVAAAPARGAPTQEEVFRSIQDNVGGTTVDTSKFMPFVLAAVGLILLLIVASQRRKRVVAQ